MITKLRSETARINGARSRGPITPEGKQACAQAKTRHGMLAQTIVLEAESHERFQELLTNLTVEIQPRNSIESALVETMAVARWRQLRIWDAQKAGFDYEMSRPENSSGAKPTRFANVFRKLSDNSRVLDLTLRYETAFDRQFSRALSLILKLRAAPLNENDESAPLPAATSAQVEDAEPSRDPNPARLSAPATGASAAPLPGSSRAIHDLSEGPKEAEPPQHLSVTSTPVPGPLSRSLPASNSHPQLLSTPQLVTLS
jgi:hypothetical protein